jgi:succinate dehydrogenase / fumarate reductase cytochrome b subunit
MRFLKSMVGRKIVMAVSGLIMITFVVFHLIGNSTIYAGWLNAYAEHLHALPPVVWPFRLVMLIALSAHVFFGILLTLENSAARPEGYAVKNTLRATFESRNMVWTGLLIGVFLLYHLLHFTFQVTNPEISARNHADFMGRPDVFMMVVRSFERLPISIVYLIAMGGLLLHLTHGIQSLFQTLGMNSERSMPVIAKGGTITAFILFLGYILIPLVILSGILTRQAAE